MSNETHIETLKQIKALVDHALKTVSEGGGRKKVSRMPSEEKEKVSAKLPDHILKLRDRDAFFKQSKTAKEVHQKLQGHYPCSLDRVVTALGRLQKRKQLRKTSKIVDKKEMIAYAW